MKLAHLPKYLQIFLYKNLKTFLVGKYKKWLKTYFYTFLGLFAFCTIYNDIHNSTLLYLN